ncbi:MAG: Trm112 family protein [Acidimicrobiia bacterium]
MVPDELLQIMQCIRCEGGLTEVDDELVCDGCGYRYPVRDGIPVMLEEEARPPNA